jgi:hypothetical protein
MADKKYRKSIIPLTEKQTETFTTAAKKATDELGIALSKSQLVEFLCHKYLSEETK